MASNPAASVVLLRHACPEQCHRSRSMVRCSYQCSGNSRQSRHTDVWPPTPVDSETSHPAHLDTRLRTTVRPSQATSSRVWDNAGMRTDWTVNSNTDLPGRRLPLPRNSATQYIDTEGLAGRRRPTTTASARMTADDGMNTGNDVPWTPTEGWSRKTLLLRRRRRP